MTMKYVFIHFIGPETKVEMEIDTTELRRIFPEHTADCEDIYLGEQFAAYTNDKKFQGHFGHWLIDKRKKVA